MKNTFVCKIVALAAAAVISLSPTSAFAGNDAFNWVVTSGGLTIVNHAMAGTTSTSPDYLMGSAKDTAATAVVELGGTDLEYGGLSL